MIRLFGGIEAGGTKIICTVGSGPDDIRAQTRLPFGPPEQAIAQAAAFFQEQSSSQKLDGVGIASFGPLDLNPASPTHGHVFATIKSGWDGVDFAGLLSRILDLPVCIDTDVNGAALGEYCWGAAQGLDTFIYITVGTGIGGGGMAGGRLLHGLLHPEIGHMLVPHDLARDPYPGFCDYHRDCLEGLACGPAIAARWGQPAHSLPADHPAWALEAHYLALGLHNLICALSPQRIILGGGVMAQRQLFPLVRQEVQRLLNGYLRVPAILDGIDSFIVPPALGDRAGALGALALAMRAGETD